MGGGGRLLQALLRQPTCARGFWSTQKNRDGAIEEASLPHCQPRTKSTLIVSLCVPFPCSMRKIRTKTLINTSTQKQTQQPEQIDMGVNSSSCGSGTSYLHSNGTVGFADFGRMPNLNQHIPWPYFWTFEHM